MVLVSRVLGVGGGGGGGGGNCFCEERKCEKLPKTNKICCCLGGGGGGGWDLKLRGSGDN